MATKTAKFFQTEHIDEIFSQARVIKDGVILPLEIELSIFDSCNRSCGFCPRSDDAIAPNTNMKMEPSLYLKLAEELKEIGYKGLIMLSGFGEPFLHKGIVDIIKAFNFTYVNTNTNGDILTRDKIQQIIDAGIYKVLISVYEEDNLEDFQRLIEGFEDHVTLRNRYDNHDLLFNNRAGSLYKEEKGGLCYYPYYMMTVDCNGDTYPCCHEWTRRLKMGNLYQNSFWDIWTGSKYRNVRRIIDKGERDLSPCRNCNVNGKYRGGQNYEYYLKHKF